MLVSNSHDFVFIRVPKAGSTSALFYFMNAGLYNLNTDIVAVDGRFHSWKHLEKCLLDHPENYLTEANNIPPLDLGYVERNVHTSYSELVNKGRIKYDMPCFSTVRNPIDRLCSFYFYNEKRKKVWRQKPTSLNVDDFCYLACMEVSRINPLAAKTPQYSYFPEHATLWNTENLYEHAVKDITAMGGTVKKPIHVRKTRLEPNDYKKQLSHEVIQMVELKYAKDFELWEKAYAVYN